MVLTGPAQTAYASMWVLWIPARSADHSSKVKNLDAVALIVVGALLAVSPVRSLLRESPEHRVFALSLLVLAMYTMASGAFPQVVATHAEAALLLGAVLLALVGVAWFTTGRPDSRDR